MDGEATAVELSRDRFALSDLIGLGVRDGDGASLGRIYEVRAHWERDGQLVIDELITGRTGLWRRLRGPGTDTRGIDWESIAEISDGAVVVASRRS